MLFPDGRPASPLLRRVLWLYLALALVWMGSAYVITVDVIVRHDIRVDAGGNLLALENGPSSPAWWTALEYVTFAVLALAWLLALACEVASCRHSSGERRQQLKWLLGGFGACLAACPRGITLGRAPGVAGRCRSRRHPGHLRGAGQHGRGHPEVPAVRH